MKLLKQQLEKVKLLFLSPQNLIGKHLDFVKSILQEEIILLNMEIIAHLKFVDARLKFCDHSFASNFQYIFRVLEWSKRNIVTSSIQYA